MSYLPRASIFLGIAIVSFLVALKLVGQLSILSPEQFFCIAVAGGAFLSAGMIAAKNITIGPRSPWGAWVTVSSLSTGLVTDVILDKGFFKTSQTNPVLDGVIGVALLFVCFGWWVLVTGSPTTISAQGRSRPIISVIGGVLIAIALGANWLFKHWLNHA